MEPASTFVIEENLSIKTFLFSDLLCRGLFRFDFRIDRRKAKINE
jgi:D-alanine-D-alanine ligase-like ATP-grasp enzyme